MYWCRLLYHNEDVVCERQLLSIIMGYYFMIMLCDINTIDSYIRAAVKFYYDGVSSSS